MAADFDLVIIGGGPAGIAAALQAKRDGTQAALVADETIGGLVGAGHRLDNLPGFPGGIAGLDYAQLLQKQATQADLEIISERAVGCRKQDRIFMVATESGRSIGCRSLILAQGTKPLPFELDGLDRVQSAGALHRDIRDLPQELAGQRVIVIGSGEAAADSALSITDRGALPVIIARGSRLKIAPNLAREIEQAQIEIRTNEQTLKIETPENNFTLVTGNERDTTKEHAFNRLLVCIGRTPNLELWRMLGGREAPNTVHTEVEGVFTAGDMIRGIDRYVATATGDGARAARLAAQYLAGSNSF